MTGHEPIIEMRMNGYAPQNVWVFVLDAEPKYFPATHPAMCMQNGSGAEIHVTPMDKGALDFRCLRGLVINLQGNNENRVLQVLRQIERSEPLRVITSLPNQIIDSASTAPQSETSCPI